MSADTAPPLKDLPSGALGSSIRRDQYLRARICCHVKAVAGGTRSRRAGRRKLIACAAASRNNRPREARDLLTLGRTAGAALAGGTAVAPSSWGRFDWRTVVFQHIENQLVAERPERVLGLSQRVEKAGDTVFMRRHLLDVAQAHAMLKHRDEATAILERLRAETPEWLRHQQMATSIFGEVQQMSGRVTRRHRALAGFFDAP